MPSTEQLRSRLMKKLSELFQLDQPDLDFGFYRIMHAKAREIQEFIHTDLLKIVEHALGSSDDARRAELQEDYENAVREAIEEYGVAEPERTPKVQKAKAALDSVNNTAGAEADIYDHLYRFFERYYDSGDFISRRYFTRETSGKSAPYAVPYNGEEVKLHWANADQYYIKSAEYFSNFTFDLRQAGEVRAQGFDLFESSKNAEGQQALKVHFKVKEATEGEHGNVKAGDQTRRFFIIHKDRPVTLDEAGELICHFEYRPDPEKSGQDSTWREKRNAEAVETILNALETPEWLQMDTHENTGKKYRNGSVVQEYLRLFKVPAPTEKNKKRPLLARYVNQYTARNTMDYFIHKDLGGFLRRELDFYIKNEVMHLDDLENADVPSVESYLAKIKVMRNIAGKLIDLLAQLEDFQKKLWLKKKFIVEANYCITLDRVPEELYPEVAANEAQCEEWTELFAIDEIQADLHYPGFSRPLTVDFLKANSNLVLDTRFFDEDFKARLVASIGNFDEQCDGLLIHSENFQALNLLQERYREQVKCVYIDPPYNTDASPIIYKNAYRNSSWLSLMENRLVITKPLCHKEGIMCVTIDDFEQKELESAIEATWGINNTLGVVVIRNNPSGRPTPLGFAISHEYAIFVSKMSGTPVKKLPRSEALDKRYKERDEKGKYMWELLRKRGSDSERKDNPKAFFPFYVSQKGKIRLPKMEWDDDKKKWIISEEPNSSEIEAYPIDQNGIERRWRWGIDKAKNETSNLKAVLSNGSNFTIYYKYRPPEGVTATTNWIDSKYSSTEHGTGLLKRFFNDYDPFSFPKSIYAVQDCLLVSGLEEKDIVLDYFGGSGTTAHAVISFNRQDGGARKYILAEIGDYFDTVLKPRVAKVVYSENWQGGRPADRHTGISHCFKYIRLESYEDTLNNLRFDDDPHRKKALSASPSLREDYMLRYLLDVETRGSQSLLNIDAFADPTAYTLEVKKPGTDQYVTKTVDLIETFNYLIGLRVVHTSVPQTFHASFKRIPDPELPKDQHTRLAVDGRVRQDADGPWWFRKIEGWVPGDPADPENGQRKKVLIVWRKLTSDIEQDNLMLDEWFDRNRISTRDFEFDIIYVNGSNNLLSMRQEDENGKVRLIEEEFMKRMWDMGGE